MKILIIGFGSIGRKHFKILSYLSSKFEIRVCTKTKINKKYLIDYNKKEIIKYNPDYIIISSETFLHLQQLKFINSVLTNKVILIEKPLFHKKKINNKIKLNNKVFVGYNLRFDPIILFLKNYFKANKLNKLLSLTVYCGSYLPQWRKNINYTKSYSSHSIKGGGVELDLSHEIDYIRWIFGEFNPIKKINNKISELNIQSNDHLIYLAKFSKKKYLNLTLNYFSKIKQRFMIIDTKDLTMNVDLVKKTIIIKSIENKSFKIKKFKNEIDLSYKNMHLDILNKNYKNLCSYKNAIETLSYL